MANEFIIRKGLVVNGSGSTVVDIQGSQGQLFSITDDLTGTLFAVSDISGIPVFQVDASGESLFDGNLSLSGSLRASGSASHYLVGANVGIGTTSPADKLEVQDGNIRIEQVGNVDAKLILNPYSSTIGTGYQWELVGTNANNSYNFQIRENGVPYVTIDNSVNGNTGNVGIGTTAPSQKLDVAGAINIQDGYTLRYNNSSNISILGSSSTGLTYTGLEHHFKAYDGSSTYQEYMTIDVGGNIGIGTTSPDEKLHITDISGANIILNTNTGVNNSGVYMSEGSDSTPTQNGAYVYYDAAGNAFKIATGTTSLSDRLTITRDSGALKFNQYGSGTFTGTATQRLGVDSSGNVIELPIGAGAVDGSGTANYVTKWLDADTITTSSLYDDGTNVGIGTTSPQEKLHISKTDLSNELIRIRIENDLGYADFGIQSGYARIFSNNSLLYAGSDNQTFFYNGGNIVLTTNYLGNVGIGTTSPNTPLEVHGEDIATTSTTTSTSVLRLVRDVVDPSYPLRKDSAVDFMLSRQQAVNNNLPYTRLDIRLAGVTDSSTPSLDVMSLLYNGNVGIGTTSPETKLHIASGDVLISNGQYYGVESNTGGNYKIAGLTTGNQIVIGAIDYTSAGTIFAGGDNISFTTGGVAGSSRMYINSSGNVGIGTTNPATNLEVISDTGAVLRLGTSDTVVLDGDTIGRIEFFSSDSTNTNSGVGAFIDLVADGDQNNFAPLGDLRFATSYASVQNATTRMTIKGNGNVGIGTTSPSRKLTIGGIANTGDGLKIEDPTNTAFGAHLTYYDISSEVWLGGITNNVYNDTLSIHRDATRTITITSTGNVGIGTTNPSNQLEISSGGGVSNPAVLGINSNDDNTAVAGSYIYLKDNSATKWQVGKNALQDFIIYDNTAGGNKFRIIDNGNILLGEVGGNVGIGTTSPSQKLQVTGNLRVTGAYYDSNNSAGTSGQVLSSTATGTDWVSLSEISGVDGSGTANYVTKWLDADTITTSSLYDDGTNVGIGTTSPAQDLTLYRDSGDTNFLISSNNGASQIFFGDTESDNIGKIDYDHSDNSLNIVVNSAERMRIDSSGNVGIGTTSPATKLHVNGDIGAYTSDWVATVSGSRLLMKTFTSTGDTYSLIQAQDIGGNSNNALVLQPYGDNVGIGTTSPAVKLDVNSGGTDSVATFTSTDARARILIADNTDISYFGTYIGTTFIGSDDTPSGNTLNITSSGNVGIGTTSPGAKLDVAGNARFQYADSSTTLSSGGSILRLANNDTTVNNISAIDFPQSSAGSGFSRIGVVYKDRTSSSEDQDMFFRTIGGGSSSEVMRLSSEGNVGIGTTNPFQKLHVAGNGRFTGGYFDVGHGVSTEEVALSIGNSRTDNGYAYIDLIGDTTYTDYALRIIRGNTGPNTTSQINHRGTGDFDIRTIDAANITFDTTGLERLRITSDGNVCVGTTSPFTTGGTAKLTIAVNNAIAWGASNTDMSYFRRTAPGEFQWQTYNSGNTGEIHLQPYGGNVGIGTTSPSEKLDVVGNVQLGDGGTGSSINYNSTDRGTLKVGGSEIMRLLASGNVGIGTTIPSAKLVVRGADSAADFADYGIAVFENQQGEGLSIGYDTGDNYSYLYSREVGVSSRGLRLNGSIFVANVNGNVGIGTTTPNASAILDIVSTTKGVVFPRMTKVQRASITSPTTGLIVYQTDSQEGLYIYKSTGWVQII